MNEPSPQPDIIWGCPNISTRAGGLQALMLMLTWRHVMWVYWLVYLIRTDTWCRQGRVNVELPLKRRSRSRSVSSQTSSHGRRRHRRHSRARRGRKEKGKVSQDDLLNLVPSPTARLRPEAKTHPSSSPAFSPVPPEATLGDSRHSRPWLRTLLMLRLLQLVSVSTVQYTRQR